MDLSEIEDIIERDLPGRRMSKKSLHSENELRDSFDALETEKPEASTPEFETLREKYLTEKFFGSADSSDLENSLDFSEAEVSSHSEKMNKSEDVIVTVRPKEATDLRDDSSHLKTAVISATEKKVIGQQG